MCAPGIGGFSASTSSPFAAAVAELSSYEYCASGRAKLHSDYSSSSTGCEFDCPRHHLRRSQPSNSLHLHKLVLVAAGMYFEVDFVMNTVVEWT